MISELKTTITELRAKNTELETNTALIADLQRSNADQKNDILHLQNQIQILETKLEAETAKAADANKNAETYKAMYHEAWNKLFQIKDREKE